MAPPPIPPAGSLAAAASSTFSPASTSSLTGPRAGASGASPLGSPPILRTARAQHSRAAATSTAPPRPTGTGSPDASPWGRRRRRPGHHNRPALDNTAEVEILGRRTHMMLRLASTEERAGYWPKVNEIYSDYDAYQARTQPRDPRRRPVAGLRSARSRARRWARLTSVAGRRVEGSPEAAMRELQQPAWIRALPDVPRSSSELLSTA